MGPSQAGGFSEGRATGWLATRGTDGQTDRQTEKDREKDWRWLEAAATSSRAAEKRREVKVRKAERR